MTTALLTVRRIRAAELFVGRQRAGAAVGEGSDRSRASPEQEVEQRDRVGDVGVTVPVRVERGKAARFACSAEHIVQRAGGVGDVDKAAFRKPPSVGIYPFFAA